MKKPPLLQRLARLLRCPIDRVEDILRNDTEHARRVLGRRAFLSTAAALAIAPTPPSTVFSFPGSENSLILFDERAAGHSAQAMQAKWRLVCSREIGRYVSVVFLGNYAIGAAR